MPTKREPASGARAPWRTRSRNRSTELNAHHPPLRAAGAGRHPGRARRGAGDARRSMFVGEQPGDQEDLQGRPFVGPAGQLLDRALAEAGIDRKRGLPHECGQALQVRAARQAPHPPEADRRRGQALPLVAGEGAASSSARGSSWRSARRPCWRSPARRCRSCARAARREFGPLSRLHHRPPLLPAAAAGRGDASAAPTRSSCADLARVRDLSLSGEEGLLPVAAE